MFSHSSRVQTRSFARYPLIHQIRRGFFVYRYLAKAKVGSRCCEMIEHFQSHSFDFLSF